MKNPKNATSYYSMGIDAHKHFCQIHILCTRGDTVWKGRLNEDEYECFAELVEGLDAPCRAVFESSMNWHVLYDTLCEIEGIEEVQMANPLMCKIICSAQNKNDKVDAHRLAMLLRLGMVPRAHATGEESRKIKELVRQRAAWVGMRTKIRNRTHRLLGGIRPRVELPQCSDFFGRKGIAAMKKLDLPEPDATHLRQNLAAHHELGEKISELEKELQTHCREKEDINLLASIPGVGKILSCVIGAEIDGIARFSTKKKFIAYSGLAPTNRGSAGVVYQGKMLVTCNKWLKWAFIEAAWVAIGCDSQLGSLYKRHRARGKSANNSIVIVAQRMAKIVWQILREKRPYEKRLPEREKDFPARSCHGLVDEAA